MVDTMKPFQQNIMYDELSWNIWSPGFTGLLLACRRFLQRIIRTDSFDLFIIATVVANTCTMGLQGYVEENDTIRAYMI